MFYGAKGAPEDGQSDPQVVNNPPTLEGSEVEKAMDVASSNAPEAEEDPLPSWEEHVARRDDCYSDSEYVQKLKVDNKEFCKQASNRTLLTLKEVLIKATEMKVWHAEQFKQVEAAAESVRAYKELLASATENQLFTLLNIARSLGEEPYNLFKSLIDCYKLEREASDGFKDTFSDLFPRWKVENPPEELKSELMAKYLNDRMEEIERKIEAALTMHEAVGQEWAECAEGYLEKEARKLKEARKGIILKSADNYVSSDGLVALAAHVKNKGIKKEEAKAAEEAANKQKGLDKQAEVDEMSKDALRREIVACMRELTWGIKVLDEAFFNCNEKNEVEDIEVLRSILDEHIEKASYFKNVLDDLSYLLPGNVIDPPTEPILEKEDFGGNGCFSGIDVKNLMTAVAAVAKPVEEEMIGTGIQLPGSPLGNASDEQEQQRAALREQLEFVKSLSMKELINDLRDSSLKGYSEDYIKLIMAELKNRTEPGFL